MKKRTKKIRRKKLKPYRIYGNDNDMFGIPFPNIYLKTVKANSPLKAVEKYYRYSKKKHLGWPKYSLSARLQKKKK